MAATAAAAGFDLRAAARAAALEAGFVLDLDAAASRDLDQIEVADELPDGRVRVRVGIADVDTLVPRGSALDHHAAVNTASVYTGLVERGDAAEEAG